MRIAAFNVENLFDRVKAFNDEDPETHKDVLDAHAALNKLIKKPIYSAADKKKMLALMEQLGALKDDESPFVWLRKIRGKIVVRPRKSGLVRREANGREDWVGWVKLKTARVEEEAIAMTARMIRDMDANSFRHLMVIDGHDWRGIDVGIMARRGSSIPSMRSHVDETFKGKIVFSRDCPEYIIETPGGKRITVQTTSNPNMAAITNHRGTSARPRRPSWRSIIAAC